MPDSEDFESSAFRQTRWTFIRDLQAGHEQRRKALESLCAMYRPPLVHFARRSGLRPQDAEDVVQEFLADLVTRQTFEKAERARGRLRSFLLAGLQQQIADWYRRQSAKKRGGGIEFTTIDDDTPSLAVDEQSPDKLFDRKWAETIRNEVLRQLREKWYASGKGDQFDILEPFAFEHLESTQRASLAESLGTKTGNVSVMLTRMRREFSTHVRAFVVQTVSNLDEVEDELREIGLALIEQGSSGG
jgi:RNA polymerase sigma-70 factor (ECF subfamily)